MEKKRTIQSGARQIGRFFRENRRMRGYPEMPDLFGVRSKRVVHFRVNKLIDSGLLL